MSTAEELKNELGQLDEDSLFAAKMLEIYANMTNEYRNGWKKEEVRMEKR